MASRQGIGGSSKNVHSSEAQYSSYAEALEDSHNFDSRGQPRVINSGGE